MMHSKFIFASAAFAVLVMGSCSAGTVSTGNSGDVIEIRDRDFNVADGSDGNEIAIFDSDFNSETGDKGRLKSQKREEGNRDANGDSIVSTMYDGAGNRTDARIFNNHSRLRKVIVRTGVDGKIQVFVYGNNGEVKRLSVKAAEEILRAPGDAIANAAKIYETREQRDRRNEEDARNRAEAVKSAESNNAELRRNEPVQNRTNQTEHPVREPDDNNQN